MIVAKHWQRVEGAIIFGVGIVMFLHLNVDIPWWLPLLLFFAPDISFAGYLMGPRVGAAVYNLVHVYAFGLVLLTFGVLTSWGLLGPLGALWLAHSGFDRMLGYGLKSPDAFTTTHLGPIGRKA